MKSAVAFVLTVLMFATPATQVLAQTPQQQDAPARQDVPPAQAVALDVTPEQSVVPELPMTNPMDALLPAPNVGLAMALNAADAVQSRSWRPGALKVVLIVAAVVAVVFVIIVIGFTLEQQ